MQLLYGLVMLADRPNTSGHDTPRGSKSSQRWANDNFDPTYDPRTDPAHPMYRGG